MPTQLEKIRQKAEELLRRASVKVAPISISKIARRLGVILRSEVLEQGVSGFLYRDDGKVIVVVNRLHPATRQRFTAAHEFGHLALKHDGKFFIDRALINFRDRNSSTGESAQEREANAFAAELLMPAKMLERDLKKGLIDMEDEDSIERLAKKYKVSVQALTYRLANLGIIG